MIKGFKIPNVTFKVREGDTSQAEVMVLVQLVVNGLIKLQMTILKIKE